MMLNITRKIRWVVATAALTLSASHAFAASGEMGTGIPHFGSYSNPNGVGTIVWRIDGGNHPFAQGCDRIVLSVATMGMDAYKVAMATLLSAKVAGKRVRFFAHAPRDDGCGADYVEMVD
jgi:hypothetical protein